MLGSPAGEPAWARPALIAITLLTAALMLTDVTRSVYGNTYYANGALAASRSWTALLTSAADLGGYVSLDKGPLPDWLMGISGRIFGFGSLSVMLPSALYGIATVLVLHDAVRRTLGREVAILAALLMALTPVAVLVGRYNTPDALLLLMLVCAAWRMSAALESSRLRDVLLSGAFLGLAFNTKMLEAYLVLPALLAAVLLGLRAPLRRRLLALAGFAAATAVASGAWFATMMLIPAADRPYVGDTTGNSWFELILGGNGVKRVTGTNGSFGSELEGRLLHLLSHRVGGQIGWLLPLALAGIVVGLLASWRSRRRAPAFGGYVLWSTWGLTTFLVFSFSVGVFHAYYTSVLAPPVATLAAAALVTLARSARRSMAGTLGLAALLAAAPLMSYVLLSHAGNFLPGLRWIVVGCGSAAGAAVILTRLDPALQRPLAWAAAAFAAVALLAGPTAYSIATVTRSHTGYDPIAGPVVLESRPPPAAIAALPTTTETVEMLIPYLRAHRGSAHFLLAATDSRTAAPIALGSELPVITMGGFQGADPTPTVAEMEGLTRSGRLRYVLLDGTRERPKTRAGHHPPTAPDWVKAQCFAIALARALPTTPSGLRVARSPAAAKFTLYLCGATARSG